MPVAASEIMDFIERSEGFRVERYEIASPLFGSLRRNLREIIRKLQESQNVAALEMSDVLRTLLSEWLTVPVTFDESIVDAVRGVFGNPLSLESRWGHDISLLYEASIKAAEALTSIENPVREKVEEQIRGLVSRGESFKIYCHRRARRYFEELLNTSEETYLSEAHFLHSARDYREVTPFDVLIKVGPLRSRGWGSVPDALLSAPRYRKLVLVVWSGCGDEQGFPYDPSAVLSGLAQNVDRAISRASRIPQWTVDVFRTGDDPIDDLDSDDGRDELDLYRGRQLFGDVRHAKLVQIDSDHGILYPINSQILSFDPTPGIPDPVALRIPGETLLEGMYLIRPIVEELDLGSIQAEHGHYSKIWKARLEEEWRAGENDLIQRLHSAGLDLVHLGSAVRHWLRPPGTVIHAPQRIKHFEILLNVLGLDTEAGNDVPVATLPFWKSAWNEIRRSRGEAIQAGVLEHELVEEQLLSILSDRLPALLENAARHESFNLTLSDASGMKGTVLFFPILAIEDGYTVPETELKIVCNLGLIDKWRD